MKMPNEPIEKRISRARALDGGKPVAISVHEAAARLRIGRSLMDRLISEKKVRAVKIGGMTRVPVAAIDEYLAKLEKESE